MHQSAAEVIAPDSIDDVADEVVVVLARQPARKVQAAILGSIQRDCLSVQRSRLQRTQQSRMVDIAGSLCIDNHLAGFVAVLLANAREQISELVILLLRPLLQRMIVASRAGEPLS